MGVRKLDLAVPVAVAKNVRGWFWANDDSVRNLAEACRLEFGSLEPGRGFFLPELAGLGSRVSLTGKARDLGVTTNRSRRCESCWADSPGVWLLDWASPFVVACTLHDELLTAACHSCLKRFNTVRRCECSDVAGGSTAGGADLQSAVNMVRFSGDGVPDVWWDALCSDEHWARPTDSQLVTDHWRGWEPMNKRRFAAIDQFCGDVLVAARTLESLVGV
jgi:hypothetical protein